MYLHTTLSKFTLLCFFLLNSIFYLQAQELEDIIGPLNYSCSDFLGVQDDISFYRYVNPNNGEIPVSILKYNGSNLFYIPFPSSIIADVYHTNVYEGKSYFLNINSNLNLRSFYSYDGTDVVEVEAPAGFQITNFVTEYNGLMYLSLKDESNTYYLYSYDGTTLTAIPSPDGLDFGGTNFIRNGSLYLSFVNDVFDNFLYRFDGATLESIPTPANIKSIQFLTEVNGDYYFSFINSSFDYLLYKFSDGDVLTAVPHPTGYEYFAGFADENSFYAIYRNPSTLDFEAFIYDGTTTNLMPSPDGDEFSDPYHVVTIDGVPYFTFTAGFLFSWNGSEFVQVNQPAGFQFENWGDYADSLNGKAYFTYLNTNTGKKTLMELNVANNELIEVPYPTGGWTPDKYITTAEGKLYFTYTNASDNEALFSFDGIEYTEITNPTNRKLAFFFVENAATLFFRYDDLTNFNGKLFKLELPIVSDNIGLNCPEDVLLDPVPGNLVTFTWTEPTGSTNCPSGGLSITQISGPTLGIQLLANNSTYEITYEATDACGNVTQCSFNVTEQFWYAVTEFTSCPTDINVNAISPDGVVVNWDEPVLETNCPDGAAILQVTGFENGNVFPVGTTLVEFQGIGNGVGNGCGVGTLCSFLVTVVLDSSSDSDNDGVPNDEDCEPDDPTLPTTPGSPCDDGDEETINDVILENGCSCKGVLISNTIETLSLDDKILEIYPNPFNESISIKNIPTSQYKITISTVTGKVIYSETLLNDKTNLSHLQTGCYILTLTNLENNISKSSKIVKIE